MTTTTTETRAGVTAEIVSDDEGVVSIACTACGTSLTDDDRGPFYDTATDNGTAHVCPDTSTCPACQPLPEGAWMQNYICGSDCKHHCHQRST